MHINNPNHPLNPAKKDTEEYKKYMLSIDKAIEESKLKQAIQTLVNALKEDKTEGSFYYGWQANIAMSFINESIENIDPTNMEAFDLHKTANNAAKRFLDMLIYISENKED